MRKVLGAFSVVWTLALSAGAFTNKPKTFGVNYDGSEREENLTYTLDSTVSPRRTLESKLSDSVSVKDAPFLAKCDGTTDDSAAFNAAMAAFRLVTVPAGTCSLGTAGISMPTATMLVGAGRAATTLKYTGTGVAVTRDGVQGAVLANLTILASGSSASLVGLLDTNVSGANLRNENINIRIIGDQSPPVVGSMGHFFHSVNANSLYYNVGIDEVVGQFDKCVRLLGDDGTGQSPPVLGATGGANANKFPSLQLDGCVTGVSFEGYASANYVDEVHCNGGGQPYDQLCASIGDGTNTTIVGNEVRLYADNSVSGHVGKSFAIANNATRNIVRSYTSGGTQGTNGNAGTSDRNWIVELNATSGRVDFKVGNIQLLSDGSVGGVYLSPTSGNPGIFQCSATNVANNVACVTKSNTQLASAGDLMWSWRNNSGFTNSTDLRTGGAGTDAAAIDLNGGLRQAGQTFANLGNPGTPPNGTIIYCSDCTIANPCASGGTGAFAKRLNGVWICN